MFRSIPLVEKPGPVSVAAADAFAEDGRFGIGGWFLLPGAALHPSNIYYFTYQLQHSELPRWFTRPGKDLQAYIAVLEALAQLVLLDCQRRVIQMHSIFAWISLRQFCDNAGGGLRVAEGPIFAPAACWCASICSTICS